MTYCYIKVILQRDHQQELARTSGVVKTILVAVVNPFSAARVLYTLVLVIAAHGTIITLLVS